MPAKKASPATPHLSTEPDVGIQENIIASRLRDLKTQRLQVQVRIDAPALGEPEGGSEADREQAASLDKSIQTLEDQYTKLGGK